MQKIIEKVGGKQLLFEMIQYLFRGETPVYNWNWTSAVANNHNFTIKLPNRVSYLFAYSNATTLSVTPRALRKYLESRSCEQLLHILRKDPMYESSIQYWLAKRSDHKAY